MKQYKILGLMSGSSLDGLDIALCSFNYENEQILDWDIIRAETLPYEDKWVARLSMLPEQNALTYAKTHTYFGHYMGELVNQFLENTTEKIDYIASHGHTIFHYPNQMMTAQIGDGAALAMKTGLPVISDFRTSDIALQGEGTPLAPTVDYYLFPKYNFLLNLGGIANLTYQYQDKRVAYDVSPCNQILNALAREMNIPYDPNGQIAATGQIIPELETRLHQFPYYQKPFPKSLDNQYLTQSFLPKVLNQEGTIEDKMHTCCQVFGKQIAENILQFQHFESNKILSTGGGTYHAFLLDCIQKRLGNTFQIVKPSHTIIDYKEALLMALLGLLRIHHRPNCFSAITGASNDTIGGAIYQGRIKTI